eukprot:SAG22_NODE_547_length_9252_cov_27.855894_2_plen_130_part_00
MAGGADAAADANPDARNTMAARDARVSYNEFSDSDDDDESAEARSRGMRGGGRRNKHSFRSSDGDTGLLYLEETREAASGNRSYSVGRRGGRTTAADASVPRWGAAAASGSAGACGGFDGGGEGPSGMQ